MSFQDFGLHEDIVHGVQSMGYVDPTAIQVRAFPVLLSGRDLIGSAPTGTGKTAAFALPVLTRILKKRGGTQALILEPTRELAAQVETAFRDFARFTNLRVTVLYGGVGYGQQKEDLARGVDVVVATPGRLLDHLEQGTLKLDKLNCLILDEMDRMLDMGFLPDVRRIVNACPAERQTLLFSATMPPEVERVTAWVQKNPERIQIGADRSPAETVSHAFYPVAMSQKFDLLQALLEKTHYESVIVFVRTKQTADAIAHRLKEAKHAVAALHSNRTQIQRQEALEGFKSGTYEVMVATDIASRGIDIEGVSHVINFDVPQHAEDYVHRIGRTGRAQRVGDAFTLVTGEDLDAIRSIEHFIGREVPRQKLEGFDYVYTALLDDRPAVVQQRKRLAGRRRR